MDPLAGPMASASYRSVTPPPPDENADFLDDMEIVDWSGPANVTMPSSPLQKEENLPRSGPSRPPVLIIFPPAPSATENNEAGAVHVVDNKDDLVSPVVAKPKVRKVKKIIKKKIIKKKIPPAPPTTLYRSEDTTVTQQVIASQNLNIGNDLVSIIDHEQPAPPKDLYRSDDVSGLTEIANITQDQIQPQPATVVVQEPNLYRSDDVQQDWTNYYAQLQKYYNMYTEYQKYLLEQQLNPPTMTIPEPEEENEKSSEDEEAVNQKRKKVRCYAMGPLLQMLKDQGPPPVPKVNTIPQYSSRHSFPTSDQLYESDRYVTGTTINTTNPDTGVLHLSANELQGGGQGTMTTSSQPTNIISTSIPDYVENWTPTPPGPNSDEDTINAWQRRYEDLWKAYALKVEEQKKQRQLARKLAKQRKMAIRRGVGRHIKEEDYATYPWDKDPWGLGFATNEQQITGSIPADSLALLKQYEADSLGVLSQAYVNVGTSEQPTTETSTQPETEQTKREQQERKARGGKKKRERETKKKPEDGADLIDLIKGVFPETDPGGIDESVGKRSIQEILASISEIGQQNQERLTHELGDSSEDQKRAAAVLSSILQEPQVREAFNQQTLSAQARTTAGLINFLSDPKMKNTISALEALRKKADVTTQHDIREQLKKDFDRQKQLALLQTENARAQELKSSEPLYDKLWTDEWESNWIKEWELQWNLTWAQEVEWDECISAGDKEILKMQEYIRSGARRTQRDRELEQEILQFQTSVQLTFQEMSNAPPNRKVVLEREYNAKNTELNRMQKNRALDVLKSRGFPIAVIHTPTGGFSEEELRVFILKQETRTHMDITDFLEEILPVFRKIMVLPPDEVYNVYENNPPAQSHQLLLKSIFNVCDCACHSDFPLEETWDPMMDFLTRYYSFLYIDLIDDGAYRFKHKPVVNYLMKIRREAKEGRIATGTEGPSIKKLKRMYAQLGHFLLLPGTNPLPEAKQVANDIMKSTRKLRKKERRALKRTRSLTPETSRLRREEEQEDTNTKTEPNEDLESVMRTYKPKSTTLPPPPPPPPPPDEPEDVIVLADSEMDHITVHTSEQNQIRHYTSTSITNYTTTSFNDTSSDPMPSPNIYTFNIHAHQSKIQDSLTQEKISSKSHKPNISRPSISVSRNRSKDEDKPKYKHQALPPRPSAQITTASLSAITSRTNRPDVPQPNQGGLQAPISTGISTFPYQCPECPRLFAALSKCCHHLMAHEYPICVQPLSQVNKQLKDGKGFACLQCAESFNVWGDCLQHLEDSEHYPNNVGVAVMRHEMSKLNNHPTQPPRESSNEDPFRAKFRCPQCGTLFTRWNLCLDHLVQKKHHPYEEHDRERLCMIENQKAPYRCPECGRLYTQWSTCLNHLTVSQHFPCTLESPEMKERLCLIERQTI